MDFVREEGCWLIERLWVSCRFFGVAQPHLDLYLDRFCFFERVSLLRGAADGEAMLLDGWFDLAGRKHGECRAALPTSLALCTDRVSWPRGMKAQQHSSMPRILHQTQHDSSRLVLDTTRPRRPPHALLWSSSHSASSLCTVARSCHARAYDARVFCPRAPKRSMTRAPPPAAEYRTGARERARRHLGSPRPSCSTRTVLR